jgi:hypothetical protein
VLDAGDYMLSVKVFGEDIQGDGSKARIHTGLYIHIYTHVQIAIGSFIYIDNNNTSHRGFSKKNGISWQVPLSASLFSLHGRLSLFRRQRRVHSPQQRLQSGGRSTPDRTDCSSPLAMGAMRRHRTRISKGVWCPDGSWKFLQKREKLSIGGVSTLPGHPHHPGKGPRIPSLFTARR